MQIFEAGHTRVKNEFSCLHVYTRMIRAQLCLLFILFFYASASSQVIDNTTTFTTMHSERYLRINYDNDFFTKKDYYYTQGIHIEFVHPHLSRFLLNRLLIRLPQSTATYGLAIDHFGYTPTSIQSNSILYGDRPFSGNISFKTFAITTDDVRSRHLSSAFVAGIIGPAAFGKEMQTGIHRWLKNVLPLGWQYQIKNDLILNYQVNYEKKLLSAGNFFQLSSAAEARAGTHNNKLTGGFSTMIGHFKDPYQTKPASRQRWQYYFYAQPLVSVIGYDATLQGGLFNRKSPYTIGSSDITRFTFQTDAGLVLSSPGFYLSYSQSVVTREFSTGSYHRWGGINLGIRL